MSTTCIAIAILTKIDDVIDVKGMRIFKMRN